MRSIRLVHSVDVPIYRQIMTQFQYMIEAGQLTDGDKLPSARTLAASLGINRNTVAKAYAELRDAGLVKSNRSGMMISGSASILERALAKQEAEGVLAAAINSSLAMGLTAPEVSNLAVQIVAHLAATRLRVCFIECNQERAEHFAGELSAQLEVDVVPVVLSELSASGEEPDLLLTTLFHLAEVRRIVQDRDKRGDVLAVVVAPQVQTLVQLAGIVAGSRVGILFATEDQDQSLRDSLVQLGLTDLTVVEGTDDVHIESIDVIVVPVELTESIERLRDRVQVIEFVDVLDEASTRMVAAIIEEKAANGRPSS